MKVIILGAGQVGASVAEGLVSEENDITVVDFDGPRLGQLQDRLDLRTVVGNAATPSVLRRAGAEDADMIIAGDIREVEIEGRRMVMEANVVAIAAGRPRAAHVR